MNTKGPALLVVFLLFLCGVQEYALGKSRIFYRMRHDRNIYVIEAEGQNRIALTENEIKLWMWDGFQWSPDGVQIVFHGDRDGWLDIFVMDANGRNIINLTNRQDMNYGAVWSPDGKQIAYVQQPDDAPWPRRIRVMNPDGSDDFQLTDIDSYAPAWSPDARKIAFARRINQATTHLYWFDVQTR